MDRLNPCCVEKSPKDPRATKLEPQSNLQSTVLEPSSNVNKIDQYINDNFPAHFMTMPQAFGTLALLSVSAGQNGLV